MRLQPCFARAGASAIAGDNRRLIATIDGEGEWQGLADPVGGDIFEIDIAIDTRLHPFAAKLLEAGIDELARLAEAIVTGVAKRKHGKVHLIQPGCGLVGKCLPEKLGIVRHFTFAVGGGDDNDALHDAQTIHGNIVQGRHHRLHALGTGGVGYIHRQRLGIAGLGAEENVQHAGRRLGSGSGNRCVHTHCCAGMKPGQEAG